MNLNLCGYSLIALLLFICFKIYRESDVFNFKYVISDVDGKNYYIQDSSKLEMDVYVFCYGELINLKKVKEVNHPKKRWPVIINGLKRSLNIMGKKHLVFGIKDVKGEWCNGVLIKVSPTELNRLQKREKLYTLKIVDKTKIEFPYKKTLHLKPTDTIVSFYPKTDYVLTKKELTTKQDLTTKQHLKTQKYIHICHTGATAISRDFYNDFIETTTII
jgi:hypothetical protein